MVMGHNILHEARLRAKKTQEAVAHEAGIVLSYYRSLEKGEQHNPTVIVLVALAGALEIPVTRLIQAFLPKGHK